jgi:hypothetical protein
MGEAIRPAHSPEPVRRHSSAAERVDAAASSGSYEAQTASALNHPNIISIYDIAADNAGPHRHEYVPAGRWTPDPAPGNAAGELLKT